MAKMRDAKLKQIGDKMKPWTKEEDEIIIDNYKNHTCKEMAKLLPGRSECAIRNRARRIKETKVAPEQRQPWTKKELDILKKSYPTMSNIEVQKLLPGKTKIAIKSKASKLKIQKNYYCYGDKWSKDEIEILQKYYPKQGTIGCHKKLPHRSRTAIESKAQALKIKCEIKSDVWTKEELKKLKELVWVTSSNNQIHNYIPSKSVTQIINKKNKLKKANKLYDDNARLEALKKYGHINKKGRRKINEPTAR